jgi:hypothetical protein
MSDDRRIYVDSYAERIELQPHTRRLALTTTGSGGEPEIIVFLSWQDAVELARTIIELSNAAVQGRFDD